MKKIVGSFIILFIIGCGSNNNSLSLKNCGKNGNFCYHGINYGPIKSKLYKKGIIDGCKTAEGEFIKDYSLSSSSKDYFNGWILGRSKCKQILPNEGTRQEEINSKKRAEYEIRKLKEEQSLKDVTNEGIINNLINSNSDSSNEIEEVEY